MSDTNSFLDAMQRRGRSRRDPEDDDGSSFGDGSSPKEDDGTGVPWQYDAENPPPSIDKGTEEEDDDDEVVAIQPPTKQKPDDDDDDEEFSEDSSNEESEDEPAKAKPSKKGRATAAKESSKAPGKGSKQVAAKQVEKRIKWAKLVQEEVYEDGTTKTFYPFVEKTGYYLDELAAQVVVEQAPHLAGYGKGKEAWLKAAIKLRRQQDPTGKFVLPTITPKKLKARFDAWMSFVPIYRAKASRDSGTDDEISDNPVLDAIETMYDEKEAGAAVASGKRAADAKKTANDKAGAEYIKCKAAGVPVPKEVVAVLDDTSPEEGSSDDSKALVAQKKRRVSAVSALTSSTQKGTKASASNASKCADELAQLGSAVTIRAEAKLIEAKNKAEALKIRRMELELMAEQKKARLAAREKNEEAERKFKQKMGDWFATQAAKEAAKENTSNKE